MSAFLRRRLRARRGRSGLRCGVVAAALLAVGQAAPAQTASSTEPNPSVVFDTFGDKSVTLRVCNAAGCTDKSVLVRVLDPLPRITSATAGTLTLEAGQLVDLASTATGKPPLASEWSIALAGTPLATLQGATTWWDSSGVAPGLYTATLRVTNASGAAVSDPIELAVTAPRAADFYTLAPCRLLDTRSDVPLVSGAARAIVAAERCGIPAGARALAANLTVTAASGGGHVTVYPGNYPAPATSSVNFAAGQTRANFVVLPLASDGSGSLAARAGLPAGGSVHLIVDVSGYFLAPP